MKRLLRALRWFFGAVLILVVLAPHLGRLVQCAEEELQSRAPRSPRLRPHRAPAGARLQRGDLRELPRALRGQDRAGAVCARRQFAGWNDRVELCSVAPRAPERADPDRFGWILGTLKIR